MNRAWTIVAAAAFSWALVAAATSPVWAAPLGYQFFCAEHAVECQRSGASTVSFDEVGATLQSVNSRVNNAIRPQVDKADTWRLSPSAGDCEDYALTKRSMLRRAGVPTNAMRIGIYKLPSGENHAVLVVSTDRGDVVLDNLQRDLTIKSRSMNLI